MQTSHTAADSLPVMGLGAAMHVSHVTGWRLAKAGKLGEMFHLPGHRRSFVAVAAVEFALRRKLTKAEIAAAWNFQQPTRLTTAPPCAKITIDQDGDSIQPRRSARHHRGKPWHA